MKLSLLITFALLTIFARAQTSFEKVIGGPLPDAFKSIIQTSDGGYLAAGSTKSYGMGDSTSSDVFLVKLNSTGSTLWTATFGNSFSEEGNAVLETPDGNYLVAGYTNENGGDGYVVKVNTSGVLLWEQYYGSPANYDIFFGAVAFSPTEIALCGVTDCSYTCFNMYAVKIDLNGAVTGSANYPLGFYSAGYGISKTNDGGLVIGGYTGIGGFSDQVTILKTDASLNMLWANYFGGAGTDDGFDVVQSPGGNYFLLGNVETFPDPAWLTLFETDSGGNLVDSSNPAITNGDFGFDIANVPAGGFAIAAYTSLQGLGNEMLLVRLDSNGDTTWTKHYGGSLSDLAFSVFPTTNGGFALAGETSSFGAVGVDGYIVVTDANGNVPCPTAVSFSANNDACVDELLHFINTTPSTVAYEWTVDGNVFSDNIDADYFFDSPGSYQVTLDACGVTSSQTINVHPNPDVSFTPDVNGTTVTFTLNSSVTPVFISWNFGDGSSEVTGVTNPSHNYLNPGMYWVILEVIDQYGCDSIYIAQINLVGINPVDVASLISVYPNPASESIQLEINEALLPAELVLKDVTGRTLQHFHIDNSQPISLLNFSQGIYLAEISTNQGLAVKKIMVQ